MEEALQKEQVHIPRSLLQLTACPSHTLRFASAEAQATSYKLQVHPLLVALQHALDETRPASALVLRCRSCPLTATFYLLRSAF